MKPRSEEGAPSRIIGCTHCRKWEYPIGKLGEGNRSKSQVRSAKMGRAFFENRRCDQKKTQVRFCTNTEQRRFIFGNVDDNENLPFVEFLCNYILGGWPFL